MKLSNKIKFSFILPSLFITSQVLAYGIYAAPAKPYFDGFYLGAGAGVGHAMADITHDYTFRQGDPGDPSAGVTPANSRGKFDRAVRRYGFNANIFGGFGKTFQTKYYLGGEIFANSLTAQPKLSNDFDYKNTNNFSQVKYNINTKVRNPYSFGGSIRAGYLIGPRTMAYVGFGLDYAKFEVRDKWIDTSNVYTNNPVAFINNINKWQLAYMPSIGMEAGICDHMSLRLQYTYTGYPSFQHSDSKIVNNNPGRVKINVNPSRGVLALMLSYLFN
jgi:opacity protein-like surface antigen